MKVDIRSDGVGHVMFVPEAPFPAHMHELLTCLMEGQVRGPGYLFDIRDTGAVNHELEAAGYTITVMGGEA